MKPKIIVAIILIATFSFSTVCFCQDATPDSTNSSAFSSKPFLNSVLFGTAAGLLLGFVIGGGFGGLARGASLGLYGGLILGWYVSSDHGRSSDQVSEISPPAPRDNSPKLSFSYNF